jgi:ubiquinone/menaquinone biosynthesis C-methylase UbiE
MLKVSEFFDELKLRKDSHIADFGCGVGENVKLLSELCPDGKVFAVDVHKDLLEHIEMDILKEKRKKVGENTSPSNFLYSNIVPVWGDIEKLGGTRLRDNSIDNILIANTFFLLQHKKVCVLEMKRVLKRGGRILFVDWHTHLGKSTLHKLHVLRESEIETLFTEAGLSVYPKVYKDDNHFVLVIEKR